jgi:two-component system osmolarity sensor histidine kinase EnvZ
LLHRKAADFALSPSQSGSGLGLAIVNRVARLHGGVLWLENRAEGGARVTITFTQTGERKNA